jgi:hypothetical protein
MAHVPNPTAQQLKAVPLFASIGERDRELLAARLAERVRALADSLLA